MELESPLFIVELGLGLGPARYTLILPLGCLVFCRARPSSRCLRTAFGGGWSPSSVILHGGCRLFESDPAETLKISSPVLHIGLFLSSPPRSPPWS